MAKILSHNAPLTTRFTATAGHEAVLTNYEEIDLTSEIKILSNGTNVLAVQLLNDKNNTPTFSSMLHYYSLLPALQSAPSLPQSRPRVLLLLAELPQTLWKSRP